MENSLLGTLFKLKSSRKEQTEDFVTEILAYLFKDPAFLISFLNNIGLNLKDDVRFSISTRAYLKKINELDTDSIPDIIMVNKNYSIYIENKIDAEEGFEQLKRYAKQLEVNGEKKKKILLYITKKYNKKECKTIHESCICINSYDNVDQIIFHQLRWFDVYGFLSEFVKNKNLTNPLAEDFLVFMKNLNLDMKSHFSLEDQKVLLGINRVLRICDATLDGEILNSFKEVTNRKKIEPPKLTKIKEENIKYMCKSTQLNGMTIYLGYSLNEKNGSPLTQLMIEIKKPKKNEDSTKYFDILLDIDNNMEYQVGNTNWKKYKNMVPESNFFGVQLSKKIGEFESKKEQVYNIQHFFKDALRSLEKIKEKNELPFK